MVQVSRILYFLGWMVLLTSPSYSAKRRKVVPCDPFPYAFIENGRIRSVGDQKYMIHCDVGYYRAGPREVRCYQGNWTYAREPKCLKSASFCDDAPIVRGGDVLGNERRIGSVVQYMCHSGFVLLGEGTRRCLPSGHWSGVTPACMDENEPLKRAAERLKEKFVTDIGSYSNDSVVAQGRSLDSTSLMHGLELVILLDRSSSIDPHDFKIGVDFVKSLLEEFGVRNGENNPAGTRAAVITFGNEANVLFNLDNETITGPVAASKALHTLKPNGGATAMEDAFMTAYMNEVPLREKSKRALFLLTDGEPNKGSTENTLSWAKQMKRDFGYEIFTVGIGRGINRAFLAQVSSEPLINHVFIFNKYSNLKEIIDAIKDESTNRPISAAACGYIESEQHYLKVWNWLAAIYIGLPPEKSNSPRLSFCSGTLICSQWVITAASCFYHVYENNVTEKVAERVTKEVFVVLGETHLKHKEKGQMNFYAEHVVIHPDFQPLNDLHSNLALIQLNSPAPMERFRPACLPSTIRPVLLHLDLNTNASTAGWGLSPPLDGRRDITGSTVRFQRSNTMLTLEVESACRRVSGEGFNEKLFCASGPDGTRTCMGDLGSPIIAVDPDTNLHHVIGVLSSKSNCEQRINQYSDLTKHARWIDDVTHKCQLQHQLYI